MNFFEVCTFGLVRVTYSYCVTYFQNLVDVILFLCSILAEAQLNLTLKIKALDVARYLVFYVLQGIDPEYDEALDKFYTPYHEFIDMLCRLAVNSETLSEVMVTLSAMVGFEAVPLHSTYFPKLWLDVRRVQVSISICTCYIYLRFMF